MKLGKKDVKEEKGEEKTGSIMEIGKQRNIDEQS